MIFLQAVASHSTMHVLLIQLNKNSHDSTLRRIAASTRVHYLSGSDGETNVIVMLGDVGLEAGDGNC